MGLLDTIGEALDNPWSATGSTPEQISASPWARRGMVLSALGSQIIPSWNEGHRPFYPQLMAYGQRAREQEWQAQQRQYALAQAQAQAEQQAQLARVFTEPQQGPQAGPQGALGAPGLGPPGPTLQRALAASDPAPPMTPQKAKAEQYRRAAHMVAPRSPEAAKKYMDLADQLDPQEEFYQAVDSGQGLVQFGKRGTQLTTGVANKPPELPPDVRTVEYVNGKPLAGTGAAGFETLKDYRKSGANSSNVSVSVGAEKSLVNSMGLNLGKQLDDGLAAAKSALPSIETAQTLRRAVDTGKIIAGPTAKFRVLGLQIGQMLGVGGKDSAETLLNTRTAIQSMAKAELDAAQMMKGQGQITEAERDIIRRAAAGNIDDMTAPELRLLSVAMEKTARGKLAAHKRNVQSLESIEGAKVLMPLYQLPEAPAYQEPGRAPTVRRYDPKTGTFSGGP